MSSVTLRKSVAERRANQANKAAQIDAADSPPQPAPPGAAPVLQPRRAACALAVLLCGGVVAQAFATAWVRARLANVVYSVLGMLVLDLLLARVGGLGSARWYVLHAAANGVVGMAALPDLLATLAMPTHCFAGEFSLVPAYVVPAVHLYHLVAFECSAADWAHHLVFAGVICPLGLFFEPGPVQNTVAFFICGLPGGLDYAMLALVKLRRMSTLTEKVWNARINVWIRSPGLLLAAFCCLLGRFDAHAPAATKLRVPAWVVLVNALLCALNGQYYMQVVVGNTFVRTRVGADAAKVQAYNC
jgi:hypothetical protein